MLRLFSRLLLLLAFVWSGPAFAEVRLHFHSFNGSVMWGRYPHTFIVLEGTLEETGRVVNENYGFSARSVTPAILSGPVEHMILAESEKNVRKTNRHFSITLSDAQYIKVIKLVRSWQEAPGRFYDLENRNCIHFVGEIARLVGLRVDYPQDMLRRPKKWLNHITAMNPELGARVID
ncbi:hypothetical protein [Erythrobacter sp.]|uniref:hypothetical protein n=1 Tax=Erythrobacter sp. TaxID=1042 RepID=UPI0026338227|nr:hypothetical protein [Erythrobacter sp.]